MNTKREIKKHCRELATELMQMEYELYDQIWAKRIRITPSIFEHGKDIVHEINQIMPNLLVYKATSCPVDLVSEKYGFESTSDLIDFLLAYKPRKAAFNKYYEALLESSLSSDNETDNHFYETDYPF